MTKQHIDYMMSLLDLIKKGPFLLIKENKDLEMTDADRVYMELKYDFNEELVLVNGVEVYDIDDQEIDIVDEILSKRNLRDPYITSEEILHAIEKTHPEWLLSEVTKQFMYSRIKLLIENTRDSANIAINFIDKMHPDIRLIVYAFFGMEGGPDYLNRRYFTKDNIDEHNKVTQNYFIEHTNNETIALYNSLTECEYNKLVDWFREISVLIQWDD